MEDIAKELARLNQRDWLDIIAILVPIENGHNNTMMIFCLYIIHITNFATPYLIPALVIM